MKKLGLILVLIAALMVPFAVGYTGPVNISAAVSVDDNRTDPNATITWTIPEILNGTTDNFVQNGWGYDLDGAGDFIDAGNASTLKPGTGDFSVFTWIYLDSYLQHVIIGDARIGTVEGWSIIPWFSGTTDQKLTVIIEEAGGQDKTYYTTNPTMTLNRWHHVGFTWNNSADTLSIYVNGSVPAITKFRDDVLTGDDISNIRPIYVGWTSAGGFSSTDGIYDETIIFNRTLGSGEVLYLYNNKVPLDQTNATLWYDYEWNIDDQTPNGNDGIKAGNPQFIRGIRGKADMVFDGDGDYVTLDNLITLTRGTHCLNFWYKPITIGAEQSAPFGNSADVFKSFLRQDSNDWIGETNTNGDVFAWDNSLLDTNWHFWHLEFNATHVNYYRDGVFGIADAISNDLSWNSFGAAGALAGVPRYEMNASIDEFRVYTRLLTPTEILESFQGNYPTDNLTLHIDFDGDLLDKSGSKNNGTEIGDPEYGDGLANVPVFTSINGQCSLVNSSTGLMSLVQSAPATPANYTNVNITHPGATQNQTYALFQVDLYNIDVSALYTEVEATFNTLIFANGSSILDGHELTDGDTLIINGVTLTWNSYMSRFEGTTTSAIPAIVPFDTLTSLIETTYTITNGNITSAPTVVWTTDRMSLILPFMRVGDWPGAIIEMNVILMGQTMFWTFLLMAISMGVYNYSGAEVALLTWMLGWGMFSAVIHGQAQTIALILMAVGGGVYIAKFFLDRRTSI